MAKYLVEVDVGAMPPSKIEEYFAKLSVKFDSFFGAGNYIMVPMEKVRVTQLG